MDISADISNLVSDLEAIAEHMNDLSMRVLSAAIERGETSRPAEEKKLSQARRAIEKALHHLRES